MVLPASLSPYLWLAYPAPYIKLLQTGDLAALPPGCLSLYNLAILVTWPFWSILYSLGQSLGPGLPSKPAAPLPSPLLLFLTWPFWTLLDVPAFGFSCPPSLRAVMSFLFFPLTLYLSPWHCLQEWRLVSSFWCSDLWFGCWSSGLFWDGSLELSLLAMVCFKSTWFKVSILFVYSKSTLGSRHSVCFCFVLRQVSLFSPGCLTTFSVDYATSISRRSSSLYFLSAGT